MYIHTPPVSLQMASLATATSTASVLPLELLVTANEFPFQKHRIIEM